MAKKFTKSQHEGKSVKITTKTWFGTSKEDIIKELEDGRLLCRDHIGEYITTKDRVDNGLANPDRYSRHAAQS